MGRFALVNVAVITLYCEPSTGSECADEALYGMKVEILEECGDFCKVRTHYRYEGYALRSELLADDDCIKAWESSPHAVVYSGFADVKTGPEYKSPGIITLTRGAQVRVTGEVTDGGYTKVLLADKNTGYIRSSFLGECMDSMYIDVYNKDIAAADFLMDNYGITEEEFRENVATVAMLYLGTQYRWGGKSPLGIDCSGTCNVAYMLCGINIYRDAKIVDGFAVHPIDRKDIKTGDLLYFKGHIAMYLGDGKYVHSTGKKGSDGVVVNSLDPADEDYREDLDKGMIACGSIF